MIERTISLGDYFNIHDVRRVMLAARDLGTDEQLIVSMNSQESDKANGIFSVLERNNFEWTTKGAHDGRDYYIVARRKQ